jgi:ArsR family transcriptional regulator
MKVHESQAAAELLKAFSHATRLAILVELLPGPKCVTDLEELLPARQAKLVDYAQDGALRCYYLCRPALVADMLALVGRKDRIVKRTPEEIQADKERLARALGRGAGSPAKRNRREVAKR